jgi:SAM-dependent methyltransferase
VARGGYHGGRVVARYHRRRYRRVGGRLRAFFVRRALRRALRVVGEGAGPFLDVPCGTGIAAAALAAGGRRVVAADLSPDMLRFGRAARGAPAAHWVCADIERLPLRDGTVAAAVCLRFFAHLPPALWVAVLTDLARVSRGPIVIGLPMRRSSKHWWRAFKRRIGIDAKRRPIFAPAAVTAALGAAGLELRVRIWQSPFTDTALVVAGHRAAPGAAVGGGGVGLTPPGGAPRAAAAPSAPSRSARPA